MCIELNLFQMVPIQNKSFFFVYHLWRWYIYISLETFSLDRRGVYSILFTNATYTTNRQNIHSNGINNILLLYDNEGLYASYYFWRHIRFYTSSYFKYSDIFYTHAQKPLKFMVELYTTQILSFLLVILCM